MLQPTLFVKGLCLFTGNLSLVLGICRLRHLSCSSETRVCSSQCKCCKQSLLEENLLPSLCFSLVEGWRCLALALVPQLLSSKQQPLDFLIRFLLLFFPRKERQTESWESM